MHWNLTACIHTHARGGRQQETAITTARADRSWEGKLPTRQLSRCCVFTKERSTSMDLAGDGKVVCFREAKYLWDGLATLSGSLSSLSMLGLCPFELSGEKKERKIKSEK